jgi:hypothetical protein
MKELKKWVFNYRYMLIPLAVPLMYEAQNGKINVYYRQILIFGFRVAYWTVQPN